SPALPRQRFVGACRRAVEPCPSSLGGVWPGRGSPAARGPAPLPSPCEGSPSPSRASVHAGETDVQLPGPLVHLGLGPPLGCELTASTKSYTFQVDKEDDSDHILALSVVCLTDGAKDECNVVEVVGRNHENQEIAVPVANLKLSCQPLVRGLFEDLGVDGRREQDSSGCLWILIQDVQLIGKCPGCPWPGCRCPQMDMFHWELQGILLFASAPNSAPFLLFAAESGQLQAAASGDLSPGSRLWPSAPHRLAQDQ
uniref:Nucleophosmin/nucleoplasmin 3 n=1 Tax=Cyanistes caeruleus TaxID=156563 RepID=A0A8C0VRB8_CYACU